MVGKRYDFMFEILYGDPAPPFGVNQRFYYKQSDSDEWIIFPPNSPLYRADDLRYPTGEEFKWVLGGHQSPNYQLDALEHSLDLVTRKRVAQQNLGIGEGAKASWTGVAGTLYRVVASDDGGRTWFELSGLIEGTTDPMSYIDAENISGRVYSVEKN